MITVTELTPQEYPQWDAYVATHPDATPYHLTGWKAAVETAYGHQTRYLVARDDDGALVGVLPIVRLSPPLLKPQYRALPFCDVGACLADSAEARAALNQRAMEVTGGALEVRYRATGAEDPDSLPPAAKVSMLLDLPASSDALWSRFKSKLRSQIRKAEKNDLTVRLGRDATLCEHFYRVLSENMHTLGSPVHAKAWFEAIVQAYDRACTLGVVYSGAQPVAAGLVLQVGGQASIPWASSLKSHNHLSPNMLLYWRLLGHCADTGCTRFDFGRSTVEEGTFRFKQQWGARPYLLYWHGLDQPQAGTASGAKGLLRRLIETLWRKLPLSVTVSLGPRIRRYISL